MAICTGCNKEFVIGKGGKGKFCTIQCQAAYKSRLVVDAWINNPCADTFYSSNQTKPGIRRHLIKMAGCKCSRCGWGEVHKNATLPSLEIEHLDGNWKNCCPENIEIICPNCHSLTDTYKARNKGNGRGYRRKENSIH